MISSDLVMVGYNAIRLVAIHLDLRPERIRLLRSVREYERLSRSSVA